MLTDPIADMLTRIRNGQQAKHAVVRWPASNFGVQILEVLKNEGYIRGYSEEEIRPNVKEILIELKYYNGAPVIKIIDKVSKPGRRKYTKASSLGRFQNGLGIFILATSKGVMTDYTARKDNVGGEVICQVF